MCMHRCLRNRGYRLWLVGATSHISVQGVRLVHWDKRAILSLDEAGGNKGGTSIRRRWARALRIRRVRHERLGICVMRANEMNVL